MGIVPFVIDSSLGEFRILAVTETMNISHKSNNFKNKKTLMHCSHDVLGKKKILVIYMQIVYTGHKFSI